MADDSLEYAADENFLHSKANRKTVVVGNGTQLTNLTNTYPGQVAYCTATSGSFTVDKYYTRNAADSAWIEISTLGSESTEFFAGLLPYTVNVALASTNQRMWKYYTLPSTEKWYVITGIEFKNGDDATNGWQTGVSLVDADPPVSTNTQLVALGQEVNDVAIDTVIRVSILWSKPIKAGTIVGAWICPNRSGKLHFHPSQPSVNRLNTAWGPQTDVATQDTATWTISSTNVFDVNIYYRGYLA